MSFATIFLGGSFILTVILTFYYLWTANETTETNTETQEGKFDAIGLVGVGWRKSLIIFSIIFLLFFVFYGSLMVSMADVINVYDSDGGIKNTIKNEDWRLGWEFLKIMSALLMINLGILTWRIFHQTQILISIFGSRTVKNNKWKN